MFGPLIVVMQPDGRRAAFAPEHIKSIVEVRDEDTGMDVIQVSSFIGEPVRVVGDFDSLLDLANSARKET